MAEMVLIVMRPPIPKRRDFGEMESVRERHFNTKWKSRNSVQNLHGLYTVVCVCVREPVLKHTNRSYDKHVSDAFTWDDQWASIYTEPPVTKV